MCKCVQTKEILLNYLNWSYKTCINKSFTCPDSFSYIFSVTSYSKALHQKIIQQHFLR